MSKYDKIAKEIKEHVEKHERTLQDEYYLILKKESELSRKGRDLLISAFLINHSNSKQNKK